MKGTGFSFSVGLVATALGICFCSRMPGELRFPGCWSGLLRTFC